MNSTGSRKKKNSTIKLRAVFYFLLPYTCLFKESLLINFLRFKKKNN